MGRMIAADSCIRMVPAARANTVAARRYPPAFANAGEGFELHRSPHEPGEANGGDNALQGG